MFYTSHFYSQNDSRWRSKKLGKSKPANGTIGNKGCVVTAIANWHNAVFNTDITPDWLNQRFIDSNVYDYDNLGYALVVWERVARVLPQMKFVNRDRNYSNPLVWSWINLWPRLPVIVQVWVNAKFPSHFFLAIGGGKIVDSLDGKIKSFGAYKSPIGSARYNKS